jgi:hypothetical protein
MVRIRFELLVIFSTINFPDKQSWVEQAFKLHQKFHGLQPGVPRRLKPPFLPALMQR